MNPRQRRKQRERIERMMLQPLYLIATEPMPDTHLTAYIVSGSTGSIYSVCVAPALHEALNEALHEGSAESSEPLRDAITCTCPDYRGHAAADGIVCKHCCFVMHRVLHLPLYANIRSTAICSAAVSGASAEAVDCPICLEVDASQSLTQCAGCNQLLHCACVDVWLRRRVEYGVDPNCPLCRHPWQ